MTTFVVMEFPDQWQAIRELSLGQDFCKALQFVSHISNAGLALDLQTSV